MKPSEFFPLADELIERLAPQIDPRQAAFVREDAEAGAWENALSNLVAAAGEAHLEIDERDRYRLHELLETAGGSKDDLALVEELGR